MEELNFIEKKISSIKEQYNSFHKELDMQEAEAISTIIKEGREQGVPPSDEFLKSLN